MCLGFWRKIENSTYKSCSLLPNLSPILPCASTHTHGSLSHTQTAPPYTQSRAPHPFIQLSPSAGEKGSGGGEAHTHTHTQRIPQPSSAITHLPPPTQRKDIVPSLAVALECSATASDSEVYAGVITSTKADVIKVVVSLFSHQNKSRCRRSCRLVRCLKTKGGS